MCHRCVGTVGPTKELGSRCDEGSGEHDAITEGRCPELVDAVEDRPSWWKELRVGDGVALSDQLREPWMEVEVERLARRPQSLGHDIGHVPSARQSDDLVSSEVGVNGDLGHVPDRERSAETVAAHGVEGRLDPVSLPGGGRDFDRADWDHAPVHHQLVDVDADSVSACCQRAMEVDHGAARVAEHDRLSDPFVEPR